MNRPTDLQNAPVEIHVLPTKRESLVWPEAAKDQHGDDCAILATSGIDEPLRLFQLERINLGLRFAKILNELHRVFVNELAAFCDREDRPQSRDDHVDST